MSNLDKFDPDLLDDEQEFEEDEEAIRAAEAELEARDKREGREKVEAYYTGWLVCKTSSSKNCQVLRMN